MRVVVTGASGLIGSALVRALEAAGDDVIRLVRRPPRTANEREWNPETGPLEPETLAGADAVVHLAGANLADGRWSAARKREIRDSRILGTRLLAETLRRLPQPPAVWVSGSAIGFYGNRGDELLDESSVAGRGFLADVCREWESATTAAAGCVGRIVLLRTGVVLSREGGALAKLLGPFRAGLGGPVGDGRMWMSWIALPDLVAAIQEALRNARLAGPLNAVAPGAVRNTEFAVALGAVLRRPAKMRVPASVLRLTLGEMAEETVLASTRVRPRCLQSAGFTFTRPTIEEALRAACAD